MEGFCFHRVVIIYSFTGGFGGAGGAGGGGGGGGSSPYLF